MVIHHEGAITMTQDLLDRSGSAHDPLLERFADDVKNEQRAEINKMSALLGQLRHDPRATLKAGYRDAGVAASNVALVASLPKPTGVFDPGNPAGLPLVKPPKADAKAAAADARTDPDFGKRSPLLSFANTDMAFSGDLLAVGNYHGFNLYRLGRAQPTLISSVVCPGGQGDVSIVGDILIMSVEQNRGRVDCGLQSVAEDFSPERFRGIRPAFGYPACPDHTEKRAVFDLLRAESNAGITLTENFAMLPTAAVSVNRSDAFQVSSPLGENFCPSTSGCAQGAPAAIGVP
jgi:hypothetical protein